MKRCLYMIILLTCCLSVSSSVFAQTNNCVPSEEGPSQMCTFTPSQNSQVAVFDCPSGMTPCPDDGAHSIKFIVGTVLKPFSIFVTANKVFGDGFCDTGVPDDVFTDPETGQVDASDCRFVRFFGDPAYNNEPPGGPPNPNTKVPRCYPYTTNVIGQPQCAVYHVSGAPKPGIFYSGGVQKKVAWNNVVQNPAGYFHTPRMFDDPDDDHDGANSNCPPINLGNDNVFPYETDQPDDNQFVCDITTSFDPTPNGVGKDPTITGGGKSFNDFVVAWRFCTANQDEVEGDGHEQGNDGHEGDFEFCRRSREMRFEERDTGREMKGSMDAVTISANQAIISGAGTLTDGTPVRYTAVVLGNAPVIGANNFAITWITATGSVFRTSGPLIDGYIAVPTH